MFMTNQANVMITYVAQREHKGACSGYSQTFLEHKLKMQKEWGTAYAKKVSCPNCSRNMSNPACDISFFLSWLLLWRVIQLELPVSVFFCIQIAVKLSINPSSLVGTQFQAKVYLVAVGFLSVWSNVIQALILFWTMKSSWVIRQIVSKMAR